MALNLQISAPLSKKTFWALVVFLAACGLWGEVSPGQSLAVEELDSAGLDSQTPAAQPGSPGPKPRVLIKAPQSSLPDYLAYVQTPASAADHWVTLADHQEQKLRHQALVQEPVLARHFEQAQRAFLRGDLEQAKKLFSALGERAFAAHWSREPRFALHFAMLRRAQLSESPEVRRHWLLQALQLDWEQQPKADLFPPPLIKEYEELHQELKWLSLRPWQLWPDSHRLLVNGKSYPISPGQVVLLPQVEELKITLLSHSHSAKDFKTSLQKPVDSWPDLSSAQERPQALTGGHCLQPKWLGPELEPPELEVAIYYDSNCVVNQKPKQHEEPSREQFKTPRPLVGSLAQGPRSSWLWLGTALITTAVLLHHHREGPAGASTRGTELGAGSRPSSNSLGW